MKKEGEGRREGKGDTVPEGREKYHFCINLEGENVDKEEKKEKETQKPNKEENIAFIFRSVTKL